jgi:hypothetical protein
MSGGGAGKQDTKYNNILAGVTRSMFEDLRRVNTPLENQLISYATDPNTVRNAQKSGLQAAATAFDSSQAGLQRDFARQNINLRPDQQMSFDKQMGLQKSLNEVGGGNRGGLQADDTISQVLQGGSPQSGLQQLVRGGGLAGGFN